MTKEKRNLNIEYAEKSVRITFQSDLAQIDAVVKEAVDYLRSKLNDIKEHLFAVNLVLREGLTNAVRHGNANEILKKVTLLLDLHDQTRIKIVIEDEGEGFDWKSHRNKRFPEGQDHGRGMLIMDAYFTGYSYNDKGNVLYLELKL